MKHNEKAQHLIIPVKISRTETVYYPAEEITHVQSSRNHVLLYFADEPDPYVKPGSLKLWLRRLRSFGAIRIHNCFLIMPKYISSYLNERTSEGGGGTVVINKKAKVPVSRNCRGKLNGLIFF